MEITEGDILYIEDFEFPKKFERSLSFLESYSHSGQLSLLDKLTKEAMIEVLYCAYKSQLVPEKYRTLLEKRLEELHN